MRLDPSKVRERLASYSTAAAQFAGTEAFKTFAGLLDALEDSYVADLVDVTPEELGRKQGAVKQVQQLRLVLDGQTRSPKV